MQAVNPEQSQSTGTPIALNISGEFIAYLSLIAIALILRLAVLGDVPFSDREATETLAAYHVVNPDAIGDPQSPASPITHLLQVISFSVFGATEAAARLPGVIAGILLILAPLLFRDRFGSEQTFIWSALLAFSPLTFAAARTADGSLWLMIVTLIMLWQGWRYWERRSTRDALWLAGWFGAFLFLSDSGALPLLIILGVSVVVTLWWEIARAPEERDTPGDELLLAVRDVAQQLPDQMMVIIIGAVVLLVGSGLMLYPAGLTVVADSFGSGVVGFFRPAPDTLSPVWALLTAFVYNPLLLIFAVIAGTWLVIDNRARLIERFAIVWAVVGFAMLFIYRGNTPADALWFLLPAMWLASVIGRELVINHAPLFLYRRSIYPDVDDENRYWWLKWAWGLVILSLLLMLNVHLQTIGRELLTLPDDATLTILFDVRYALFIRSVIWAVITSMFILVTFFGIASMWGNISALQALGIGFFVFMLGSGMGTGWNAIVTNAHESQELWSGDATPADAYDLRETLFELALRDRRGEPNLPIVIVQSGGDAIDDDGLIAWLLRDYENARFASTIADAQRAELALLPVASEDPDLQGSYVGQSFASRERWQMGYLRPVDWVGWYIGRDTRPLNIPQDVVVLWVRVDVYDGIPQSERQAAR
jgi:hypothetical protein